MYKCWFWRQQKMTIVLSQFIAIKIAQYLFHRVLDEKTARALSDIYQISSTEIRNVIAALIVTNTITCNSCFQLRPHAVTPPICLLFSWSRVFTHQLGQNICSSPDADLPSKLSEILSKSDYKYKRKCTICTGCVSKNLTFRILTFNKLFRNRLKTHK